MRITAISDLHGYYPELPGGDLLIIAGDLTARDTLLEINDFVKWLDHQKYENKIVIGGNHDGILEKHGWYFNDYISNIIYLRDSMTIIDDLKIWGSPWTPTFENWHFMKDRGKPIKEMWDKIPDDIDILVTHGPPYGILDQVFTGTVLTSNPPIPQYKNAGCMELRKAIARVKPQIHIFGHIHEHGGKTMLFKHGGPNTICINASIMDVNYEPVNKPINITISVF